MIRVVVLDVNLGIIPRGAARGKLLDKGKIKDVPFFRYMTFEEIKAVVNEAFPLLGSDFIFLKTQKNNSLCVAEKQEYLGSEVIALAGHGCLYLLSPKPSSAPSAEPPLAVESSAPSAEPPPAVVSSVVPVTPRATTTSATIATPPTTLTPSTPDPVDSRVEMEALMAKADEVLANLKVSI